MFLSVLRDARHGLEGTPETSQIDSNPKEGAWSVSPSQSFSCPTPVLAMSFTAWGMKPHQISLGHLWVASASRHQDAPITHKSHYHYLLYSHWIPLGLHAKSWLLALLWSSHVSCILLSFSPSMSKHYVTMFWISLKITEAILPQSCQARCRCQTEAIQCQCHTGKPCWFKGSSLGILDI